MISVSSHNRSHGQQLIIRIFFAQIFFNVLENTKTLNNGPGKSKWLGVNPKTRLELVNIIWNMAVKKAYSFWALSSLIPDISCLSSLWPSYLSTSVCVPCGFLCSLDGVSYKDQLPLVYLSVGKKVWYLFLPSKQSLAIALAHWYDTAGIYLCSLTTRLRFKDWYLDGSVVLRSGHGRVHGL